MLSSGGKIVDAVTVAIAVLEDSPLFNAGKGAVFTYDGKNELDASIMDGSNLKAGAVAGVTTIKNPIKAAYAIMNQTEHVMLSGSGADAFAREQGLEIVDPSYFVDSTRYQQYLRRHRSEKHNDASGARQEQEKKFGTVRAVAATGWGEFFIRLAVAHDISAMIEYAGLSLEEAADSVIMKKLPALGGDGGSIALDRSGNISMKFNTEGMYRGYIHAKGEAQTFIYKDESIDQKPNVTED